VAPGLGEHTGAVLADVLGLDAAAIEAMRAAGTIGTTEPGSTPHRSPTR
jgi:hypothetical protein